jgi:phosphoglycerol transferase MdoB-like AlkP superfamily enzyme
MNNTLDNLKFTLGLLLILLMLFSLVRALLFWHNRELASEIPQKVLLRSFFIGMRFDMLIIGAIMLLPILAQFFAAPAITRTFPLYFCTVAGALCLLLGVVELEFYQQFHSRLNSLLFDYIKEDAKTVTSMIWNGCPVLRYLGLWLVLTALMVGGFFILNSQTATTSAGSLSTRLLVFIPLLVADAIACRGTLRSGPPLRWGDAFHSSHVFANHLALNGIHSLIKAILDVRKRGNRKKWLKSMPPEQALEITQKLLLQPGDQLLATVEQPIKRQHQPATANAKIKNVVVIIMESFSANYIGALGRGGNMTPEFDKLAQQGLLFERFFSNGTHTHQGMFASLASFPNLPGYETLMQQPQGAIKFSGLSNLLHPRNYQDLYVYNGDFAWDNQEGFFRNQGMNKFIGRFDYRNPEFIDPTWGVSDNDMFNRAHQELENLDSEKPFFAVLQTLSNHLPFTIPEPLPVDKVTGHGSLDGHLTALRYSDWALGQFFAKAQQADYYPDTLFVLLGDHGICAPTQLTEVEMLRFHIPLLMIAPGVQEQYGSRSAVVGTQVDVVPTIMGLLGQPFTHQCWGRNLLQLGADDQGFGIIKPSSSDATVAMLRGDNILVKPPSGQDSQLYNYSLYPNPVATLCADQACHASMTTELHAYIQTAMSALIANQTGV